MSDVDPEQAESIVHALTEQEQTRCSKCGEMIDVSEDTDPMSVVTTLEAHRQQCQGVWFE